MKNQNDSDTTATFLSALASAVSADWECAPPLPKIIVDTQLNIGVIEEQKPKIKHLQEELTEVNCFLHRMLPANASRGENVLQGLKKVSLIPMDQINQQTVSTYVQEAIWPGNKMLP
jgi:hypothetical protein